jgi:1-phosphofructokinase
MNSNTTPVVTVTLNPAIDQTVTIHNFTAGIVNRVEQVRSNPGGKGINVASALADYGHSVAVTGFLGRENSAPFEDLFAAKQIEDHMVRLPDCTRVAIKIHDPELMQTTDINYPGAAPAPAQVESLRQQLAALSSGEAGWFVLAGSVPPGIDNSIYAELVTILREGGQCVLVDTSGDPLRQALTAKPHVVKPNIHELETLLGHRLPDDAAVIDAARHLINEGVQMVVVSMGAKGAAFVTAIEALIARPPKVPVRSTVGAGDAMVAGIIAGKCREFSLADTARLATAFSLEALARGESGISSPASVEAAMHQVTIEEPAMTG